MLTRIMESNGDRTSFLTTPLTRILMEEEILVTTSMCCFRAQQMAECASTPAHTPPQPLTVSCLVRSMYVYLRQGNFTLR